MKRTTSLAFIAFATLLLTTSSLQAQLGVGGRADEQSFGGKYTLRAAKQKLLEAKTQEAQDQWLLVIRNELSGQYDQYLAFNEKQIAEMQTRLDQLNEQLKKRREAKDDLVSLEVQRIHNEAKGLAWPSTSAKVSSGFGNSMGAGFGGGMSRAQPNRTASSKFGFGGSARSAPQRSGNAPIVGVLNPETKVATRVRHPNSAQDSFSSPSPSPSMNRQWQQSSKTTNLNNGIPFRNGITPPMEQRFNLPWKETEATPSTNSKPTQLNPASVKTEFVGEPRAVNSAPNTTTPTSNKAKPAMTSVNNMRKVALACINFHDVHKNFPTNLVGAEDKPLLSWRVAILPFLDHKDLYDKFHHDEPWNSDHNLELLSEMPAVFRTEPGCGPMKTLIHGFDGEGAVFESGKKVGLNDLLDGASNTILVVEANKDNATFWTKPQDIELEGESVKDLLSFRANNVPTKSGENGLPLPYCHVAMCDGAIKKVLQKAKSENIKAYITYADRKVVSQESLTQE